MASENMLFKRVGPGLTVQQLSEPQSNKLRVSAPADNPISGARYGAKGDARENSRSQGGLVTTMHHVLV